MVLGAVKNQMARAKRPNNRKTPTQPTYDTAIGLRGERAAGIHDPRNDWVGTPARNRTENVSSITLANAQSADYGQNLVEAVDLVPALSIGQHARRGLY